MSAEKKVFPPDLGIIDLAWIDDKEIEFEINDYQLSLMIGQNRSYIGQVRCNSRNMSKAIKASIYYFFKTLEIKSSI